MRRLTTTPDTADLELHGGPPSDSAFRELVAARTAYDALRFDATRVAALAVAAQRLDAARSHVRAA